MNSLIGTCLSGGTVNYSPYNASEPPLRPCSRNISNSPLFSFECQLLDDYLFDEYIDLYGLLSSSLDSEESLESSDNLSSPSQSGPVSTASPEVYISDQSDSKGNANQHKQPKRYPCSYCHGKFPYPKDVERHENSLHTDMLVDPNRFFCDSPGCKYARGGPKNGWPRKDNLKRHNRTCQVKLERKKRPKNQGYGCEGRQQMQRRRRRMLKDCILPWVV